MNSRRTLTIGAAAAVGVAALLAACYWAIYGASPRATEALVEAPKEPPRIYCVLIRMTGEPRLEFLFDISRTGTEPHFEQLGLVEIVGREKTVKQPPFPPWRFDASSEPARLESEISVYDSSAAGSHTETITIELYDYSPEKGKKGWIEAGLKSIHYQNLSGQCQQTLPLVSASN